MTREQRWALEDLLSAVGTCAAINRDKAMIARVTRLRMRVWGLWSPDLEPLLARLSA